MAVSEAPLDAGGAVSTATERRALGVASGAHALHDGYTELIYIVLPLWQAEFHLSYAAAGLLRTVFSGVMAAFQIPSTFLADRVGHAVLLAAGTALCGFGFCLAGLSTAFGILLAALMLAGLGAATQHPIGSALVARAFEGPRALTAIGTYNFAGDFGKMIIPATATALLLLMPWRPAVALLGMLGFAGAAAVLLLLPRLPPRRRNGASVADPPAAAAGAANLRAGFLVLLAIAAIDSATRAGFFVLVPFLLIGKGASVTTAGFALTLAFVGGAAGKLACAFIGARFGIIGAICVCEVLTAAGMLAVLFLPLTATLVILPLVGMVLNGSSSLTYGSVPAFVRPEESARAFSIFYTGTIAAIAVAPTLSGFVGDLVGPRGAVFGVATIVLITLPLALFLGRYARERRIAV